MSGLKVGDWVLLSSIFIERRTGRPWQITKVSGSRVYLQMQRPPTSRGEIDRPEEKYVSINSVRYTFPSEAAARAVSDLDEKLSQELEAAMKTTRKAHNALFLAELERQHGQPVR